MSDENAQAFLEKALQNLVGLPLSIARNAAHTKVFHFGVVRPYPGRGGPYPGRGGGTAGAYALHVQCPWRIISENVIVTGTSDLWFGPQEGADRNDDDSRSGNLQLVQLETLLKGYDESTRSLVNATDYLVVEAVNLGKLGEADLSLSGGYRLQIFPDGSIEEDWRFIETGGGHVVVTAGQVSVSARRSNNK